MPIPVGARQATISGTKPRNHSGPEHKDVMAGVDKKVDHADTNKAPNRWNRLYTSAPDRFTFLQPGNRRRELGLPCNAVVHHLAFDAPGVNVLSLTDAVRFRQLERARFTPFVPGELTRTRERSVVRGRKVWAPGD